MNRRDFTWGAAALGVGIAATGGLGRAETLRDTGVTTVSDGSLSLSRAFLLPNGIPDTASNAARAAIAASDRLTVSCNVTALHRPEGVVIFDAGAGPNFMASAGRLSETLPQAGIALADVTDIVFTHAHPDHIWGVIDAFDDLLFPGARYHIGEAEWDYWRSDTAMASAGSERQNFFIGARNRFDAIEARTRLFKPNAEVLSGIEAVGAAGHTPGHTAFVVHGAVPTMIVGDAIANDPVSFEAPGTAWGADHDPQMGAQTRTRLLDRLASETMRFVGFHLPAGGLGRVERQGRAYRYVAEG
ncbi:MBL fold metallo-hydrolase [Fulvimarina sp. 2208YS6-2-32]|uniref:MBL fold metallo-hydrolase n=1 Tax=Fulvimarina uroteuthidis TaxID=3098149 RepID=A0ABU5I017_9HYPH|nr:MBL fold metallo-hydrolase [Fulvimarina sp. 2208YS6-2-32]MDY8108318.1 MBL fold metallo-hydrolase [Fulvimarina sp. 2208YS6-2-32]